MAACNFTDISILCPWACVPWALGVYVTGFWKISLNVTFYNSNIYSQNEERELPINLKVVTMCSSHFESPENNWKCFKKFCNPFTINCVFYVFQCDSKTDFPKLGHNYTSNSCVVMIQYQYAVLKTI